jgi:hypothetical protein
MEAFDVAVAFRVMIGRPPMGDAEAVERIDEPRRSVAANRHPGQVRYSHSPPQEVRDEESSLRVDPGKEGEG